MASHTSSTLVADVTPIAERRRLARREAVRDLAGVAVGVSVVALLWFALGSLIR